MLVLQYHKETEQGLKPGKFQSFPKKRDSKKHYPGFKAPNSLV